MGNNEKIRAVKWEDWKKKQMKEFNKKGPENLENLEKREAFCSLRTLAFSSHPIRANPLPNTIKISSKIPIFSILLIGIMVSIILIFCLSLVVSQVNESIEIINNENNESVTENGSAVDLEAGYNDLGVFEDELANLTYELSNSGYDWVVGDNLNIGGNI